MKYDFLDKTINFEELILSESDKIAPALLKNNESDIIKGLNFLASEGKFLYIHGFLGTGKRQIINYISDFIKKDVIKLEYYCKQSTVCDDVLLSFIDKIEKNNLSKAVNLNVKISTLTVKFEQYISSIKKPFLIILHSFDDIQDSNLKLIQDLLQNAIKLPNVKLIISAKALNQEVLGETKYDKKLFIKAFSKDIFKEYLFSNGISTSDKFLEEFYKYTRGYYYYTALSIKIMSAMQLKVEEFIEKIKLSGMNFDTYLGITYLNLIPQSIRNFFWFIRTIRHGISLNALAVLDLYDEFSISYLKTNLMIFESDEIIYVQDYFQQNIDISIPNKTEIKLHKYIISIYEKELKEQLQNRSILISRQAMRAEIQYHNDCIEKISNNNVPEKEHVKKTEENSVNIVEKSPELEGVEKKIREAENYRENDNLTKAIEIYHNIIDTESPDPIMLNEVRHSLASLYKQTGEYKKSQHYYELVEKYYIKNCESINLNYLHYEMTGLYYLMYKNERAIETIKNVIYSVDTPQSLMVKACTLLGNIYSDMNNSEEAYSYYQKALESLEEDTSNETLAELYFKYALANDEKGDLKKAFEYYNKCITVGYSNYSALAYSNLGSCYYESGNLSDSKNCFKEAYNLEKSANNFDGIYYTSMNLAKILIEEKSQEALNYLLEAKQSAEFINEDGFILESSIALGDYYYDNPKMYKEALIEYLSAIKAAQNIPGADISKIDKRIKDMSLRMNDDEFKNIVSFYE